VFNSNFEFISNLQYQVKHLGERVKAFESGEKYVSMRTAQRKQLAVKDKIIRGLKLDLANANSRIVTVRNSWMKVNEDLLEERVNELKVKDREIQALKKSLLETEMKLEETRAALQDKIKDLYQALSELEDEKDKNQKLKAQINRDHENSSIPSSMKPSRKKITNNRESAGRRPGGQPGHKGHHRKRHEPTSEVCIPVPEEYERGPDFRRTGKVITKQLVDIRLELIATDYSTPEFINILTRQRVHAEFPEGLVNEVTYGGGLKALAFLLNNRRNVSLAKVSELLSDLTSGRLRISTGMINGLSKVFSEKTQSQQKKIFADMLLCPVMNTDFTTARVNGKAMNVIVCATPSAALYFAREHKGHKGVKGTPIEDFQNILVHDHDKTFYNYGSDHQECLDHPSRYLKGAAENEPAYTWHLQMRELIQGMIHFRKRLDPEDNRNPDQIEPGKVKEFEARYDEVIALAKQEYDYIPPSKYYRDGFNLYKRLSDFRNEHLLFLRDRNVPYSNSLSERLLRVYKRKQHQVMAFRSYDGLARLCDSLSVIATLRAQGDNLYEAVVTIFAKTAFNDGNSVG
jgi:hypothetical protein